MYSNSTSFKKIYLKEAKLEYGLKKSTRARQLRLTVHHDGSVLVTAPSFINQGRVEKFILQKLRWIMDKVSYFRNLPQGLKLETKRGDFARYKKLALALIEERLTHFNKLYDFSYSKINVRNQKTRWGSCSRRGVLSFNYKISLLPKELCDYVVVHELCHLGEFSHSKKFWDLVARAVPNYKELRTKLRLVR